VAGDVLGTAFQFSAPKSFKMLVWFDYGAGIQLSNVLSGELDAELHISFFFFDATWRVRIVQFNGWSQFFNLIQGGFGPNTGTRPDTSLGTSHLPAPTGATTVVTAGKQGPAMGLVESQLPFTILQPVDPPTTDPPGPSDAGDAAVIPTVPFDSTGVQKFFYDNLCCAHNLESCSLAGTPQCCPDYNCVLGTAGNLDSGKCQPVCVVDGGACKSGATVGCCGSEFCGQGNKCLSCLDFGQNCDPAHGKNCCGGLACGSSSTCCIAPSSTTTCTADSDCCSGRCGDGECF
jgi:hypothetical protein